MGGWLRQPSATLVWGHSRPQPSPACAVEGRRGVRDPSRSGCTAHCSRASARAAGKGPVSGGVCPDPKGSMPPGAHT